jgi:hypothetical protein
VTAFAIVRHAKIKHGRHLVSAGLHLVRGVNTPNADKDAPPVEILVGSKKPWRDVDNVLKKLGITTIRKGGNVALEIVKAASPEWWEAHGWVRGQKPSTSTALVIEAWVQQNMAFVRRRFDENLIASVVLHLDEATPHLHFLVVCAQHRVDGREKGNDAGKLAWRLSAEKFLPGPTAMKAIVTDYAKSMARFGLVRGEDRPTGTVDHKPLKEWQAEQAEMSRTLKEANVKQDEVLKAAEAEAERLVRAAVDYAAGVKARVDREAEEAARLAALREEMLRRKEDASSAALKDIHRVKVETLAKAQAVEAERREVSVLRAKLERMFGVVDTLMSKVRDFADQYMNAPSPLMRQALGSKGPAAARIASSEEGQELGAIKAFIGGRGSGR